MSHEFRPLDPYGIQRSVEPRGVLPQLAEKVDPSLPIARDEVLIEVKCLNIDSASFHQIKEVCGADPEKMKTHILDLVSRRGKHHNPVTKSGGMLIGVVQAIGPDFPTQQKPIAVGDSIATLVSLALTPLEIKKIHRIHVELDRVEVEGHAILFATGIFSKLPTDFSESVALSLFDVAGAAPQTARLVKENDTVVVIGGGGKTGPLCLAESKRKKGVRTIAVEYSPQAADAIAKLSFVDEVIVADARDAVRVMEEVRRLTQGKMADLVINVANIPETEMASILSARPRGMVYFFSMATNLPRAALGAEGVGADLDLRIGNGYCENHAEESLNLLRENSELREFFVQRYS